MSIDGKDSTYSKDYKFGSTGEHKVQFKIFKTLSMDNIFKGISNLKSVEMTSTKDCEITSMISSFENCVKLEKITISGFKTTQLKSIKKIFYNTGMSEFDFSKINIISPSIEDMSYMFGGLKAANIAISNLKTDDAKDISHMFENCKEVTSLDLSSFKTSNVQNMANIFHNCTKLLTLDIKSFDTKNVKDMSNMFNGCNALKSIDLSNIVTSNVENFSGMFAFCKKMLSIDLSKFDTSKGVSFSSFLNECIMLKEVNVDSFDTSSATDMSFMFAGCRAITSISLPNLKLVK